jgi:hypothetical protein
MTKQQFLLNNDGKMNFDKLRKNVASIKTKQSEHTPTTHPSGSIRLNYRFHSLCESGTFRCYSNYHHYIINL